MNFKQETLSILDKYNKSKDDILWCGSSEYGYFTIDEMLEVSDFEYDNGYGSPKIAIDLMMVGKDFWFVRTEYDGAESWSYRGKPNKPHKKREIHNVGGDDCMRPELKGLNTN